MASRYISDADITLDADGEIFLDSYAYGKVTFREGGYTRYLKIHRGDAAGQGDHAYIELEEDGKDLVFLQYDLNELLRLTDNNRVLVLSGGHGNSFDEAQAADISFYTSGSVGHRGTSKKGIAVFGGDLMVSGGLHVSGSTAAVALSPKAVIKSL